MRQEKRRRANVFIDNVMPSFLPACPSRYSTQHVLLLLIEQWRICLDDDKIVGARYIYGPF